MLLSLVYFVKVFHQREVIEILQKVRKVRGLFCYPKAEVLCTSNQVARDQENIFHFELCVNQVQ